MIKLHCSTCGGTGWTKDYKYVGERDGSSEYEVTKKICLTCEGTGIEKITTAEYNRRVEEEERIERERQVRWAREREEREKQRQIEREKEGLPIGRILLLSLFGTGLYGASVGAMIGGFAGCTSCLYCNPTDGVLPDFHLFTGIFYGAIGGYVIGVLVGIIIISLQDN